MRWLLVEAGQTAARHDPELHRAYQRLKLRRVSGVAKVAIARRLAVRLYWMLRAQVNYAQLVRMSGSPSSAGGSARGGIERLIGRRASLQSGGEIE